MLKIAICDDDDVILDTMSGKISEEFISSKIAIQTECFTNGPDFIEEHKKSPFDVVFLDIDMPSVSGFEVAQKINSDSPTLIIFVTSHDELVYSSFQFQPFRFVRKSYVDDELGGVIGAVIKTVNERDKARKFEIKTNEGDVFLDLNNVEYIEIYGHWLKITLHNSKPIKCYGSLSDFEKRLEPFDFVRTHKSYLVNCRFIYSVGSRSVVLDNKMEIPLSRYKVESVKSILKEYLRRNI